MNRTEDWPERMDATIGDWMQRSFSWEANNCAFFIADVVLSMTGVDPAARYRGRLRKGRLERYSTSRFARLAVRIVERELIRAGASEVATPFAKRGDVMFYNDEIAGPCAGICNGANAVYLSPERGLVSVPRDRCHKSLEIG